MKKFLGILLLLAALSMQGTAQQIMNISFWHGMTGVLQGTINALTDEFNAQNKDVKVNLTLQGNYDALNQKLLAAVVAGTPPTLSQMFPDWTAKIIEANALETLGDLINVNIVGDLPKSLLDENTFIINGKPTVLTVPFNKSILTMFYNSDVVKADDLPKTWDEILTKSIKFNKDTNNDGKPDIFGWGLRVYPEIFATFFHQNGGSFFDKAGCLTINNTAGVEAMEYLVKLKGQSLYQGGFLDAPFGEGKVMMYIDSSAGLGFAERGSQGKHGVATARLPRGRANSDGMIQGTNIGLFKTASDAEKKAAIRYVEFLLSVDKTIFWAQQTGYLPVRASALKDAKWLEFLKTAKGANHQAIVDQFVNGSFAYPVEAHISAWGAVRGFTGDAIEKVMQGKASPKDALDEAAKLSNKEMKKNDCI